jgi:hypothetical protein
MFSNRDINIPGPRSVGIRAKYYRRSGGLTRGGDRAREQRPVEVVTDTQYHLNAFASS